MYTLEGNEIVEWCHRIIKRIAARMWCSIQEAVYWYNAMPRDDMTTLTVPSNRIYRYEQWMKGIDQYQTFQRISKNHIKLVISSGSNPKWTVYH